MTLPLSTMAEDVHARMRRFGLEVRVTELAQFLELDQAVVVAACEELEDRGLVVPVMYRLTAEGRGLV